MNPHVTGRRQTIDALVDARNRMSPRQEAACSTGRTSRTMGAVTSTAPYEGKEAAFFDLDKTVIARSSTLAFVRPLRKAGLLKHRTVLKAAVAQAIYRTLGADQVQLDRVRDQLIRLSKGWKADRIRRLVQETVDEVISPLVYAEALALIDEHRRQGREVVIVSISPEEVVRPLAGYLGVDHVIASRSAVDEEGCYAGRLAFYATGEAKAAAIGELARGGVSTWNDASATRTARPTCRCWRRSDSPLPSTRTASSGRLRPNVAGRSSSSIAR